MAPGDASAPSLRRRRGAPRRELARWALGALGIVVVAAVWEMVNETNKLIWPSTNGFGIIDEDEWNSTVELALRTVNETGAQIITEEPPASAWTNDWIQQALDELTEDGADITGENFSPIDVELLEGGN